MNTILNILEINKGKYKFTVSFENNESRALEIPIDRLENSAESVGLNFENNGKLLDPIEFMVVSKKSYNNITVLPNTKISIEFIGIMEKKGEKYHLLTFTKASYLIIPGEKYTVWFSLNGYVSEPIEMIFPLE